MSYRIYALIVASLVSLMLGMLGCAEEPAGTLGQLGNLRFAYSIPGCDGCAIDREILAGSSLDVTVSNVHPKIDYQVRSSAPAVADFQFVPHCRIVGREDCREQIVVDTHATGDAELEMFDEWTGTVLDRVTIKVRAAAVIDTRVSVTPSRGGPWHDVLPSPNGAFELSVNSDVELTSTARTAGGTELLATGSAIKGVYVDEHVIGPRSAIANGSTIEYAKAKTPGEATVFVTTSGAREAMTFRVVD